MAFATAVHIDGEGFGLSYEAQLEAPLLIPRCLVWARLMMAMKR